VGLSAVVVRADTGLPGMGFFEFARARGFEVCVDAERDFWSRELAKVHAKYRTSGES
jgi:hypothetical protein